MYPAEDTIVAPATAADGALAIVRMSGQKSASILKALFTRRGDGPMKTHRLYLGQVRYRDEVLDECMAVVMLRPHSFTGEDVVEFHCHGGTAVVTSLMDACVAHGARLAVPGEFSQRAFLNGQLDLAQAEGLCDLISARTQLERRAALQHLRGGISAKVKSIREALVDCAAEIEAHLDFPDEDIPQLSLGRIADRMRKAHADVAALLRTYEKGRVVREGARVVLAGKPNAGKSSLFNALVGRERAIVTPHPGTTRDTIEATVDIGGIAITLVDTAGMREAADEVEQIGIERTREAIEGADLVLRIVDATQATSPVDEEIAGAARVVTVMNKCDLIRNRDDDAGKHICISSTTREGMDELEHFLSVTFAGDQKSSDLQLTNSRHANCLASASNALERAIHGFESNLSGELVMVELRDVLLKLAEITGDHVGEEILDQVFRKFCLGK